MSKPTIGQIVHYTLNEGDAAAINQGRTSGRSVGNRAEAGQSYPATVVRVFDPSVTTSNLQVFLDGNDTYWATSRQEGAEPGTWCWPSRA